MKICAIRTRNELRIASTDEVKLFGTSNLVFVLCCRNHAFNEAKLEIQAYLVLNFYGFGCAYRAYGQYYHSQNFLPLLSSNLSIDIRCHSL